MKKPLMTTLENSRNYTMAVAEAMPDKKYDTRPVETIWTFAELMSHIAYGIEWWGLNHIKGEAVEWSPSEAKKSKKAVIQYLESAYESLKKVIQRAEDEESLLKGFHATLDHITHHRGQAIIHLRCQGITPPEYQF